MEDQLSRMWHDIIARPDGPLAVRFYLQPIMASLLAFRDGRRDAREGRPAFLWAVVTDEVKRKNLIRDGWRSIGKVCLLAFSLDVIYQLIVFRELRPLEGIIVSIMLAILPYSILRGPVNRIIGARQHRHGKGDKAGSDADANRHDAAA